MQNALEKETIDRVVTLMIEMGRLGRDDSVRYQQLLWGLQGEYRKAPELPHCAIALAEALALAGDLEGARQELRALLERIRGKNTHLSLVLVVRLISVACNIGMLEESRPFLTLLLNLQQVEGGMWEQIVHTGFLTGVRSGDLEILQRCAQASTSLETFMNHLRQILTEAELLSSFNRQQGALEEVLGPFTTRFHPGLVKAEGGDLRLLLTYSVNAPRARWGGLYGEVLGAMREVYLSHSMGPAAFLGHVVVRITGPHIPGTSETVST